VTPPHHNGNHVQAICPLHHPFKHACPLAHNLSCLPPPHALQANPHNKPLHPTQPTLSLAHHHKVSALGVGWWITW
jgi:hypothetical protein